MTFSNPHFSLLLALAELPQFRLHQFCKLPVGGSISLASSITRKFLPTRCYILNVLISQSDNIFFDVFRIALEAVGLAESMRFEGQERWDDLYSAGHLAPIPQNATLSLFTGHRLKFLLLGNLTEA